MTTTPMDNYKTYAVSRSPALVIRLEDIDRALSLPGVAALIAAEFSRGRVLLPGGMVSVNSLLGFSDALRQDWGIYKNGK